MDLGRDGQIHRHQCQFGAAYLAQNGLQPHKIRQFKLSNDPRFAAKLLDIVGLYMNPPEHAVVLSIDEKSQIQALDWTQPGPSRGDYAALARAGSASAIRANRCPNPAPNVPL
jgi:hypothetical protein